MKTYSKIVATVLPLVFFFLIVTVGTTYYFSRNALTDLAETWLETRLSEAVNIAQKQEQILHKYDLESIPASIIKAKMDAAIQISSIEVGEIGYIFAVDSKGIIVFHPKKNLVGRDVDSQDWFQDVGKKKGRFFFMLDREESLGIYDYFGAWDWYLVAVAPVKEVYGVADRMAPYIFSLSVFAAIVISLALMLLTRRLTRPLNDLVKGANQIGKGQLKTRIQINSRDEFAHLAKEFNRMAHQLEDSLKALQFSEEHFRSLIENATDIVTISDADGNFTYASPSVKRIMGYQPKDLIGKSAFDYFHTDDREVLKQWFKEGIASKNAVLAVEFRFKHHRGHWCTLEAISNNLLDHPSVRGIVINSRDVSKRKLAEQALKKSHQELGRRVEERTRELVAVNDTLNKEILVRRQKEAELERANLAKTEFIANMSHEIRTPLNAVLGFSEILASIISGNKARNYLNAIKTAGNTLLSLINDILDLSKIESGKLEIRAVPVNLEGLFEETHKIFRTTIDEKALTFKKTISSEFPAALILDDARLRQVLVNLVGNAVKFTQKGHIKLSAEFVNASSGSGDLEILVEDTGIGIARDKVDLIFDSFQQESMGTSRKYGGTGLGLAICKRLVELMGGHISVDSRQGRGSIFKVCLTDIQIGMTQPEEEQKSSLPIKNLRFSFEKVLIVDDVASVRFLVKELLGRVNLTFIEAENGKEGVALAREHLPDVVIMDSKMPVMDGVTAAGILKKDPSVHHIPIILLTASMKWTSAPKLLESDFDGCLLKPVNIEKFYAELVRWIPPASLETEDDTRKHPFMTREFIETMIREEADLQEELKTRIIPIIPQIENGIKISNLHWLCAEMICLGKDFNISILVEKGEKLLEYVEVFDIENICHCMVQVQNSMEYLSQVPPVSQK